MAHRRSGLAPEREEDEEVDSTVGEDGHTNGERRRIKQAQKMLTRQQLDEFHVAFNLFDKDKSGTISADELSVVFKSTCGGVRHLSCGAVGAGAVAA